MCEEKNLNKEILDAHKESEHKLLTCSKCKFVSRSQTMMSRHIQEFYCNHCKVCVPSASRTELEVHRASHVQNQKFKCHNCNQVFNSTNELLKHKVTNHSFHCAICKEVYEDEIELNRHIRSEHSSPCLKCKEVFNSNEELIEHKEDWQMSHFRIFTKVTMCICFPSCM